MIQQLVRRGYDSDPVKCWKKAQDKLNQEEEEEEEDDDDASTASDDGPDYNYLLGMQLWSLTKEKKDALLKQKEEKVGLCCVNVQVINDKVSTAFLLRDRVLA